MEKKNVLVICPMPRDRRELLVSKILNTYNIHFHDFSQEDTQRIYCNGIWLSNEFHQEQELEKIQFACQSLNIQGLIVTQDYPGSPLAAIAAKNLGYLSPDPKSLLLCHHKYLSRIEQKKSIPEATPDFFLSNATEVIEQTNAYNFPLFVKAVKSSFSGLANKVSNKEELYKQFTNATLTTQFTYQINWFLKRYSLQLINSNELLVEQCLEGVQCTLEGMVFNKVIQFLGVTDSFMIENTLSFSHFLYPSSLPIRVLNKMKSLAERYIHHIGFNYGLFNMEFMYNRVTEEIFLIEVNPRMASQFADLYEKVDGYNSYECLLSIAMGKPLTLYRGLGKHKVAASFVLRRGRDAIVVKVPSERDLQKFYQAFPDGRLELVKEGSKLSLETQDGKTYRYGLIHLGGEDQPDLFGKYELAKSLLPFSFKDI